MLTNLYITDRDAVCRADKEKIIVETGGLTHELPIESVNSIQLFEEITVDSDLLAVCLEHRIPVYVISPRGSYLGKLQSLQNTTVDARLAQYGVFFDPTRRLALARDIIHGKARNSLTMLYRLRRLYDRDITAQIKQVERLEHQIPLSSDLGQLQGYEGILAREYFAGFGVSLGHGFRFTTRSRRPPLDPANSMLSFGYTLLASSVMMAVETAGLDAYIGFLHQPIRNNPSLVLDMMEEFRAIIVDHLVLHLVDSGKITPDDFERGTDAGRPVLMRNDARRLFIREYEKRIQTSVEYNLRKTEFVRIMGQQAELLKKVVREGGSYRSFGFR